MDNLLNYTYEEVENIVLGLKEPKFRAKQLFEGISQGKSISEITTLSKVLKETLLQTYADFPLKLHTKLVGKDGTVKYIYELADGNIIEGVYMSYKYGNTLCVSTQVGCRMGCKFCASGLDGLIRNLTPGEILGQVIEVNKLLEGDIKNRKVTNIVLMGSGEPLDNYDNFIKFLELATCKYGLYFSERNISISTCGIVPKIYELADSKFNINICISLHASNDQVRHELMPISQAYSIREIIEACKHYFAKTNRRILFEYILIHEFNSLEQHARELARLLRGMNCIVNLINLNEVKENNFKRCPKEVSQKFFDILKQEKINVTMRRSLGNDIDGACGQLRRKFIKAN